MKKVIFFIGIFIFNICHALTMPSFYGELKQVKIKNASIAYYRFGQGKPLVMIPGHGDNMTTWHPEFLQKLSKNREVILFDFPGVGKSTTSGNFPNTMTQLASIVNQFVETQQLDKPDILGFSMGGSVLLYMAAQGDGENFDHLIAVGGKAGGKQTILPEPKYFKMLDDTTMSPEESVKKLLFPASAVKEANSFLLALSKLPQEKMNPKAIKAQAQAVTKENTGPGVWDKLPNIKNKVLIINGTDDVLTPVKNSQLIADAIPTSWLVRVQGAGHGVLFQMPDYSAKLIELFLQY